MGSEMCIRDSSKDVYDKVENAIRNNSGIADDLQKLMREVFKAQLPK